MLIRNTADFQAPEVGEWLLARCHGLAFESLADLMDTALCALEVMENLGPLPVPGLLGDLRVEAWAVLGNAHRVAGDREQASDRLERAAGILTAGSGDPLVEARIALFQGALEVERGNFATALDLFWRASRLATEGGDDRLTAHGLVSLGRTLSLAGRPGDGLQALRAGQRHLHPEQDPALAALALHSLVLVLTRLGRREEARRRLRRAWPLYRQIRSRFGRLHFRWLEGRFSPAGASPALLPGAFSPAPPASPTPVSPARRSPDRILRRRRTGRWGVSKISPLG